jgi:hypothetical protein
VESCFNFLARVPYFLGEGEKELLRGQAEVQVTVGRIVAMRANEKFNVLKSVQGGVIDLGRMNMLAGTQEEE